MPTQAEIIQNAVVRARNDWVNYTLVQEKEIYQLMDNTAKEIAQIINKRAVAGKIPIPRLNGLIKQISAEMDTLRSSLTGKIKRGMSKSVDFGLKTGIHGMEKVAPKTLKVGIGSSFINKEGKVIRYNAAEEAFADSTWFKINRYAMDVLLRFQPAGDTLTSQVWDLTHASEKTIRNRIAMGVMAGESAPKLSRDIRGYLVQPETLRGRVRAAYKPGPGVYKSAYKNAMRVARTEYARAYTEGMYRYGTHKDWIKGYIWRTASGDPCPICSDYDGQYFEKGMPPPIPVHPHCFCYPEPVTDERVAGIPEKKPTIEPKPRPT